ncbi:MAG: mechanosensitive ion channel family protein [Polyangiales bacterium]
MDFTQAIITLKATGLELILKAASAIAIWVVGRWAIGAVNAILRRTLGARKIDDTITSYIVNTLNVALTIFLVLAILGRFGVETTSFAALLAGAGLAIGTAWSGMLSNFASGAFMVVLRPVRVGDFVNVGGITGTVKEIGLFVTALDTPDNVRTFVGNGKVFSGDIVNFSANPFRRVDLKAQISGAADVGKVVETLRAAIKDRVKNLDASNGPDVEILEFNEFGPLLAVRPYCHTDHYWQVYFDTNRVIADELRAFPPPARPLAVRNVG